MLPNLQPFETIFGGACAPNNRTVKTKSLAKSSLETLSLPSLACMKFQKTWIKKVEKYETTSYQRDGTKKKKKKGIRGKENKKEKKAKKEPV